MDPKRFQRLKRTVGHDLTAEQCADLEPHLGEVVASCASETPLVGQACRAVEARRCPEPRPPRRDPSQSRQRGAAAFKVLRCSPLTFEATGVQAAGQPPLPSQIILTNDL